MSKVKSAAQQKVVLAFPDARAESFGAKKGPWGIIATVGQLREILGTGKDEQEAWENAAARLEQWLSHCWPTRNKIGRSTTSTQFVLEVLQDGVNGDGEFHPALKYPNHPTLEAAQANKAERDPSLTYHIVKETLVREVVG